MRQHHEVLLALYRIPAGDPMGTTHGWFPTRHLAEHRLVGEWIVGRSDEGGLVALGTPAGSICWPPGRTPSPRYDPARRRPRRRRRPPAPVGLRGDTATDESLDAFAAILSSLQQLPDGLTVDHDGWS